MIGRWISKANTDEQVEARGFDAYDLRLGDLMRGERATLGKSLLDVQRELRIKASYIAAIENSDPDAFDTPGFIVFVFLPRIRFRCCAWHVCRSIRN